MAGHRNRTARISYLTKVGFILKKARSELIRAGFFILLLEIFNPLP